jgi:predicted RNA binding protein YcfA (HicA-like mRNA interferase family)
MKAMKTRDVHRALTTAGCHLLRDTGGHEAWGCPCGQHVTAVPRHRTICPGVVRNLIRDLACLPKGWLQ